MDSDLAGQDRGIDGKVIEVRRPTHHHRRSRFEMFVDSKVAKHFIGRVG
jgi:hypothetical protein